MLSAPDFRVIFTSASDSRATSVTLVMQKHAAAAHECPMRMSRFFHASLLPILSVCAFTALSCGYRAQPRIDPGAELFHYGEEWAVIVEPYAVFKAKPAYEAAPLAYGRKGDVEKITGRVHKRTAAQSTLWLYFEKGWLPQSSVRIEQTKLKAQSVARALLN
jgi:hypothetical protein